MPETITTEETLQVPAGSVLDVLTALLAIEKLEAIENDNCDVDNGFGERASSAATAFFAAAFGRECYLDNDDCDEDPVWAVCEQQAAERANEWLAGYTKEAE